MQTYLSVDLDFWNQGKSSFPHLRQFLRQIKDNVAASKIFLVDSHEELLPDINESGCDNLINVDWHSDITNRFDPKFSVREPWERLNCGTWVTFVNFNKTGCFTWIHPYRVSERSRRGYCHYPHKPIHNPFVYPELGGWKTSIERKNKHPEELIDWWSVTHCGVCYSYDWTRWDISESIYRISEEVLGSRPKRNPKPLLS